VSMAIDPVEALDRLNAEFIRSAMVAPGWEGVLADDIGYLTANVPVVPLNLVVTTRLVADDADERIDAALAWFAERDMPIGWWIGPRESPSDLPSRLEARGFVTEERGSGMVADLGALPDEPPPDGVLIERVVDEATFRIACATMAEGFGGPASLGEAFTAFSVLGFEDAAPSRTYVARIEGRPVATSLGLVLGEVLGIFNVATIEDARRRGIGRAITLAALRDGAARGASAAVLQASDVGHGVYERLGFRDYATYQLMARSTNVP
jgi:ribosomal protein S18 acetylase RimI-like enzyme